MAFIDHNDVFTSGAQPVSLVAHPIAQSSEAHETASLSPLEWLVVAVAENDRPSTLREPGKIARTFSALFGASHNRALADGKLEALRRIAVRLWRQGRDYDGPDVIAFLTAGYSPAQFSLVAASIDTALSKRSLQA